MALRKLSAVDARRMGAGHVLGDVIAVVKELLENALDANATRVDVVVEQWGLKSISVIDNGSGIPHDALPLVGQKDHTSKVSDQESLKRLTTYGFRGGAIHAVGAAAKRVMVQSAVTGKPWMEITVRSDGQDTQAVEMLLPPMFVTESLALIHGTRVEVLGTLDKYPVRKNQQESRSEDLYLQLYHLLLTYSFARPAVHLSCYIREPPKPCFSRAPQPDAISTALVLWGPDLRAKLEPLPLRDLPFGLKCFFILPLPVHAKEMMRAKSDRMFFFVNTRPVDLPSLSKSLVKRLRLYTRLTTSKYPTCVVSILAPPNLIEVNLSANKRKLIVQPHVERSLCKHWEELLKERYPLPDEGKFVEAPDSPARDMTEEEALTQQYLLEHGDLPSTQPTISLPQPYAVPESLITAAQPGLTALPSSAVASSLSLAPAGLSSSPIAKRSALAQSRLAVPKVIPLPPPPVVPKSVLKRVAQTLVADGADRPAGEDVGDAPEDAPAQSKRKRAEELHEPPIVLNWTLQNVSAAAMAVNNVPAAPALTLAAARSATVLCCPSATCALVRVSSTLYALSIPHLIALTQSVAGTSVTALLPKLSALVYEDGSDVFLQPGLKNDAPMPVDTQTINN